MKYPEISYKRGCTVELSEIDDTMTMLTIKFKARPITRLDIESPLTTARERAWRP